MRSVEDLEKEEARTRANAALPRRRRNPAWNLTTTRERHIAAAGHQMLRGIPATFSQLAYLADSTGPSLGNDPRRLSEAIQQNLEITKHASADSMRAAIRSRTDRELATIRDTLVVVMTHATRDAGIVQPPERLAAPVPPQFMLFGAVGIEWCAGVLPPCEDPVGNMLLRALRDARQNTPTDPTQRDYFTRLRNIRMEMRRARRKAKLL
jgi:hypothetical protein